MADHVGALLAGAAEKLTPNEVAELIGVDVRTVTRWLQEARLGGYKIGGRWIVPRDALEAMLRAGDHTQH